MRKSHRIVFVVMVVMLAVVGEAHGGTRALRVLSEAGCGRATAYSEFNKIVSIGEKTHVAWLDSEDGKFLVRVQTLDRRSKKWSAVYTVGEAYDNHGGPSLTSDTAGYLHIVYYPHHHPFRYRKSLRPNDASQWGEEVQFGKKCTYSSLICTPDDKLVLACRETATRQWTLNLYEKPANGSWTGPRTIFHGNAPSNYTRWQGAMILAPDGRTIHMSFMLYERGMGDVGYAIGYLRSPDAGRTWQRGDGTKISLPATPQTIEIVDGAAKPAGSVNFRPGNIALDGDGVPWVIYSRLDRDPFEAWVARRTKVGKWEKIPLLPAIQRKWSNRGVKTPGSIVFSKDGTMYVAAETVISGTGDELAFWGHRSTEVVLLVSKDKGRTFDLFEVSMPDASAANWLPNLERPTRAEPIGLPGLIYTHGARGKTNKEIMSNEVVWCDIARLLATDCR
ncbi:MAG: BNR-4 repeat-containing protein [Phycisphaerae bacterium]|nr:BNR-4 repeat-containing protein [Phycisphaerae bacterium]